MNYSVKTVFILYMRNAREAEKKIFREFFIFRLFVKFFTNFFVIFKQISTYCGIIRNIAQYIAN